jgi:hypothetical protein
MSFEILVRVYICVFGEGVRASTFFEKEGKA